MSGERTQVAEIVKNSTLPYNNIQQTLALGLLALSKHDRADDKLGPAYTDAELSQMDRFTSGEMDRMREQAGIMLSQFSSYLSLPDDPRETSYSDWIPPIAQGFIAAFFYSLFLIVVAVLAKLGGHDLIDILRDALKPSGAP